MATAFQEVMGIRAGFRRLAPPEAMAVFLASPGARNITGQSYNVDGGIIPD